MDEIIFRTIMLPPCVRGITVVDENGDYNVYINSRCPPDIQKEAAAHEHNHILKNHFYRCSSVERDEQEADTG